MRIYNTLSRTKEEFTPLTSGEVGMYVCGVTVYDLSHVGHARSAIVFDVIRRYLRFKGFSVRFVKNYTDVEDKIIRRANEAGVSASEISEQYIAAERKDMAALGVLPADVDPKATDHIPQMIELIERLIAGGFAYVVDGDVYFEIQRFRHYGRLSGKNLDDLIAGARIEVDERKRDPRDFAVWKAAKPGEPAWPSPWGEGRPGWHIECSAMSMKYLGESFDIHGGGDDLIFPHHEGEIAQSEAVTGKPFARYWLHNGMVNFGAEKMSKSLGNILTIQSLLERHNSEALRFYFLNTHYRAPVEFGEAHLRDEARGLGHLRILVGRTFHLAAEARVPFPEPSTADLSESSVQRRLEGIAGDPLRDAVAEHFTRFVQAMDDDFNTAQARAALSELRGALNRYQSEGLAGDRLKRFLAGVQVLFVLSRVLGLLYKHVNPYEISPEQYSQVEPLVTDREDARKRRDWRRADELRLEIDGRGFTVEDTSSGPRLRWKGAPPD